MDDLSINVLATETSKREHIMSDTVACAHRVQGQVGNLHCELRCEICHSYGGFTNVWADHNRRTIRTERLQAATMGLAWVLAAMLAMMLLLAIARYALARAADAATLAPSMMMF